MKNALRWKMAVLITAAIAISYFDRQTLPIAIHAIQRQIPVSNVQFSHLQAAFLCAYALMYAGSGKLIDVLGTRRGFFADHGLVVAGVRGAGTGQQRRRSWLCSLFLLGMGEGGGFPAATKAMAEWFPAGERSTAMGLMNAGTAVGAVAAPPLIALTLAYLNWHWVFFLAGGVGCVDHMVDGRVLPGRRASQPERVERRNWPKFLHRKATTAKTIQWIDLLRHPQIVGLVLAKFLSDAAWYFYIFWLPKYLYDVQHFDTKQVGAFAWIPYAAAGVGSLLGGWFSSRLIQRGHSVNASRKIALGISARCHAFDSAGDAFAGPVRDCSFQHCLRRPAILVDAGHDDPFRYRAHPRRGFSRRPRRFRRSNRRYCVRADGGQLLDHGFSYGPVFACVSVFHLIGFLRHPGVDSGDWPD